jgi:thymidylate kinase
VYIAFEGIDGCGKSTQVMALIRHLEKLDLATKRVWEPGSTPMAEALRSMLKSDELDELVVPETELLLFNAARQQTLHNIVAPALKAGKVVVSDRSYLSTRAYQGYGRGLMQQCSALESFIPKHLMPDLIIYLDVSVEEGLKRASVREDLDRIEQSGLEFFRRVRDCFRTEALRNPDRVKRVNANQPVEQVWADVWKHVEKHLTDLAVLAPAAV